MESRFKIALVIARWVSKVSSFRRRCVRLANVYTAVLITGIKVSTTWFLLQWAIHVWNSISLLIWLCPPR